MTLHAYHDSGACSTAQLRPFEAKAAKQDATILELFQHAAPDFSASPSRVHEVFPLWPITSIRRAISNLTARGELEKLATKVEGPHGHSEHLWRLVRGQGRLL